MDGGARSPLWRQIVADVLGRAVAYAPGADLGSAHGVAWVAGVAAGFWGWERPAPAPVGRRRDPCAGPEHTAGYDALYGVIASYARHCEERRDHKIAVIPGDGIGNEVVPEGLRVLEAAGRRFGFECAFTHFDWNCERYTKTGRMMPEDGLDQLREFEAIFLGAVGFPGVPDHVSLWGLLIPIRRSFHQYINLRPVRLLKGVRSPLAGRTSADIDMLIVRENNEGEYSEIGGRLYRGADNEMAIQQAIFTRKGCDRVMRYAFERARKRPRKHVTSATKSNGIIHSMPYWDERFAAIGEGVSRRQDGAVPHRHPHRPLRPASGLVRRGGGQQPLRRHPLRPRPRHRRLHRHRARRQHQPGEGVSVDVRAGARLGAGHRRQGHRQSGGADLDGRHAARASGPSGRR